MYSVSLLSILALIAFQLSPPKLRFCGKITCLDIHTFPSQGRQASLNIMLRIYLLKGDIDKKYSG